MLMNKSSEHDWRAQVFAMIWGTGDVVLAPESPGWKVYRNTTQRACMDSLKANYPALHVLLGDEAFAVLSRAYLHAHPPRDARLLHCGDLLPDFLSAFEPAHPWPQLVDVARLDRFWIESHVAMDAPCCTGLDVLQSQRDGVDLSCPPHPATRWLWQPEHPVATLWLDARAGRTQRDDLVWQGEGLMLTRPEQQVQATPIGRAGCVFLDGCADGLNLQAALIQAHQHDPGADLAALVTVMLQQGALTIS
jgi:hypothetical protein